ncbi:MAG: DNA primase [Ruminococcaceae bacterium]|nr:DNA primase [Oscillospiraceae bacterium]
MIAREVIDDIVARNDVESVISSYVTLKRAGSTLKGLCPFHSERTPSFTVYPNTQSYFCFGCNAGGSVISFIERAENLDYVGAVEFLAARAGISIPQDGKQTQPGEIPRRRIYDMNLAAAKFFRECLFDPAIGGEGMKYLSQDRGLSGATIKHFGLGFAPNSFNMLHDHMRRLGYTDEELIKGFLCGKSQKNGRAYDYFRNRVMFPIIDTSGNIVAFGGRVMDDSKPKYLNSSDTPGFKKSRHLFALNFARNHAAENMILCEGYMDVIALHAAGFENAVATLGTAITSEQARIFAKYTKKVIISYDSDEAGQRAANRAMQLLGEVGLEVRVLRVPDAKDPDEYIRRHGADKFRRVLEGSRSGFQYKLDAILAKYDLTQPEDKIRASNECCVLISGYHTGVEREVYISQVAKHLGLPTDVIKNQVENILRKRIRDKKAEEQRKAQASIRHVGDRVNPDAIKDVQAASAEETILGLMLIYPEYRAAAADGSAGLAVDDFFTDFGRKAFEAIVSLHLSEGSFSFPMLEQVFTPDEVGRLQRMEQARRSLAENGPTVFRAAIETLKQSAARRADRDNQDVVSGIASILARKGKKEEK